VAFKNYPLAWAATFGAARHISTGATLRSFVLSDSKQDMEVPQLEAPADAF
jgi:hypothetical protein